MKSKIISMFLSLLIAFALWGYVITTVSPGSEETYYNVPVALQNESVLSERGLMITSLDDPSTTLRLSGNRTDLTKLNSANINVVADLSRIYEPGKHKLNYDISYPGDVPDNAITVLSHEPDTVTVVIENRITKEVEVHIEFVGTVANGYICDKENAVLDHKKVTVSGPKSLIDRIERAKIQVDLTDKRAPFLADYLYTLCDAEDNAVESNLIETSVEQISLSVTVQRVKEVPLEVTVVDGGGATEQTSTVKITPQKIRISGSDTALASIKSISLGTVNLGELLEDTELTFPISLPEGVNNESGVNEAVVGIQFPELITRSFTVTTFEAVNIPEGMEAEVITQQLEVSVRGPEKTINAMKESDIKVMVDCTNAQQGAFTVKPAIVMAEDFAEAGAVGTYSVSVELRQAEEKAA